MHPDVIGWLASMLLVTTLGRQVWKEYQEGTSKGVSKWLFIGQTGANLGFIAYSWLIGSWVFLVANCLIFVTSVAGLAITIKHRRREGAA